MSRLPRLTCRELVDFLKSQRFQEVRSFGEHWTLWHESRKVAITVPMHTGCEMGRRLAARILKDAGFAVEDFPRFL